MSNSPHHHRHHHRQMPSGPTSQAAFDNNNNNNNMGGSEQQVPERARVRQLVRAYTEHLARSSVVVVDNSPRRALTKSGKWQKMPTRASCQPPPPPPTLPQFTQQLDPQRASHVCRPQAIRPVQVVQQPQPQPQQQQQSNLKSSTPPQPCMSPPPRTSTPTHDDGDEDAAARQNAATRDAPSEWRPERLIDQIAELIRDEKRAVAQFDGRMARIEEALAVGGRVDTVATCLFDRVSAMEMRLAAFLHTFEYKWNKERAERRQIINRLECIECHLCGLSAAIDPPPTYT